MKNEQMLAHLKSRYLNPDIYKLITIAEDTVTFPLWNFMGQIVGYHQYRPMADKARRNDPRAGRYFTYLKKSVVTAWGIDLINPNINRIYITEGIFKACRFHNKGLNALAMLTNDPVNSFEWLHSLGYEIFSVCDNDKAGAELSYYGNKSFTGDKKVDDMSELEFDALIHKLETKQLEMA